MIKLAELIRNGIRKVTVEALVPTLTKQGWERIGEVKPQAEKPVVDPKPRQTKRKKQ